jgi:ferric-dicitrate binding protein FerR (iron transport regulator)
MSPEVQTELRRLLSALCDGMLSDDQHARLEQLLDADEECRREYLQYMDMHARLLSHPRISEAVPQSLGEGLSADPPAVPAQPPVPNRRRRRMRQALSYVLVATATLAASLLVQFFWWHPEGHGGTSPPSTGPGAARPEAPGYVATLMQTADCAWQGSRELLRAGSRLRPSDLHLLRGAARIRFDAGCELVVEGPAHLRLDSGTAATLLLGKVVFRTNAAAAPFDLHTPSATLVDLGTEYAVAVEAEGEEVQVFEGEVERMPLAPGRAEPEYIRAGEARRAARAAPFPSHPGDFDPTRFVRVVPCAGQVPLDPAAGLLAYEGFDYKDPQALDKGKADGGFGWTSPWGPSQAWLPPQGAPKSLALNIEQGLSREGATVRPVGGRFDCAGFAVYYRRLATPVRLDAEGVYYLSFLFRRQGPPGHPMDVVALLLRPDEEARRKVDLSNRLVIGAGGGNQVYTHLGRACSRASLPLRSGTTYLLVAKIVAGSSTPGQVFVRVYGPREPIDSEEPGSWTLTGPPFESHLVFSWLGVHVNSKNRQMIDEIRLGTTWSSVTAPWIEPPGVGQEGKP